MFCALNGATRTPRFFKIRQNAVAIMLLPLSEDVPTNINGLAIVVTRDPGLGARDSGFVSLVRIFQFFTAEIARPPQ